MLLAITRVFSSRGRTLRRGSWWERLMNVAAGSIFAHTYVRSDHGYQSLAKDVLVQIPMTRTVLLQNTLQGQRQVALLSLNTWWMRRVLAFSRPGLFFQKLRTSMDLVLWKAAIGFPDFRRSPVAAVVKSSAEELRCGACPCPGQC